MKLSSLKVFNLGFNFLRVFNVLGLGLRAAGRGQGSQKVLKKTYSEALTSHNLVRELLWDASMTH